MRFYCSKCGKATVPGIPMSGYCAACRKLLRLDPGKLDTILETPEAAVIIAGEVIGPQDRMNDKAKALCNALNAQQEASRLTREADNMEPKNVMEVWF